MLVSLTVGKVDAGVAVLLTEDKRLIEFPSVLLPPDISSGSIVDVTVARNHSSEARSAKQFAALQEDIFQTFGISSPSVPALRCRNATQTAIVLEWDPIELATAELRSLALYRNGQKAGNIPRPREMLSTKISGLALDTEYTFHLVLKTSAGTFPSEKLVVRTHKMTDLTGISVTPGIMTQALRDSLKETVERIGARMVDGVRIDTTHFVTTEGRGRDWEKAVEMNLPVVVPDWVKGCEREGRIVGVKGYYLNADPRLRQSARPAGSPQLQQQRQESPRPRTPLQSPRTEITPPTPEQGQLPHSSTPALGTDRRGSSASDVSADPDSRALDRSSSPAGGSAGGAQAAVEDASSDEGDESALRNNRSRSDGFEEQRQIPIHSDAAERKRTGSASEEPGDFDEVAL